MPARNNKNTQAEPLALTLPWSCTHFGDQSEIEAYIPATGRWEVIADIHMVGVTGSIPVAP